MEERFYNQELKERYLFEKNKYVASSYYIELQFRKCSEFERQLGKDVANWSLYEAVEYYKLLGATSLETLICLNNIFSNYCQFCIEQQLVKDNQNHFLECSSNILSECVNKLVLNQKILSRNDIIQLIDKLPNPRDQFILLGLFEFGKSKDFQDIFTLNFTDLNRDKKELFIKSRDNNQVVKISSKLIDIIDSCFLEDKYYSMTGNMERKFPLVDNGTIIKAYPNEKDNVSTHQKGRRIYHICQRMFDYLGLSEAIQITSIVDSGKIHLINELSKKYNINQKDFITSEYYKEIEQQFNSYINTTVFYKKYQEFLK